LRETITENRGKINRFAAKILTENSFGRFPYSLYSAIITILKQDGGESCQ
jgi:hypothetical protein